MVSYFAKFIVLLTTLGFGIAYYIDIMKLELQDKLVVEILLLFLAITLLFQIVRTAMDFTQYLAQRRKKEERLESLYFLIPRLLKTKEAIFLMATAPYIILFPKIGFFVSSFIYVLVVNILLGTKGKIKLIAIPTGLILLTYVLFVLVFNIRLPKGILF